MSVSPAVFGFPATNPSDMGVQKSLAMNHHSFLVEAPMEPKWHSVPELPEKHGEVTRCVIRFVTKMAGLWHEKCTEVLDLGFKALVDLVASAGKRTETSASKFNIPLRRY